MKSVDQRVSEFFCRGELICLKIRVTGIHPGVIAESYKIAAAQSEKILREIAIPVSLDDTKSLEQAAVTSLSSKVTCCFDPLHFLFVHFGVGESVARDRANAPLRNA